MILRKQNGDTLVEVVVALAILSLVLLASYGISSRGFHLGIAARERQQAAALLQQQAEVLRNTRDNSAWLSFSSRVTAVGSGFYMDDAGAVTAGPKTDVPPFTIVTTADCTTGNACYFVLKATWPSSNGGPDNSSELSYHLVNDKLLRPLP